jgi:4-hydroxy-3-methylbut-2-en-1-yl diphosphate reductase
MARTCGVAAHLIDGPGDIDFAWFSSPETVVGITAGASAPEAVVQKCIGLLQDRFGASVETRMICDEQLRFALPKL